MLEAFDDGNKWSKESNKAAHILAILISPTIDEYIGSHK